MLKPDWSFFKKLYLALAAVLLAGVTANRLHTNHPQSDVLIAIGVLTFAAYEIASWYPAITGSKIHFGRQPSLSVFVLVVLLLFCGLFLLPIATLPWMLLAGSLTLFYFLQWKTSNFRSGLRSLFLVKNVLVAGVWTWFTVVLPTWPDAPDYAVLAGRFLLVGVITVGLDLRDMDHDRLKSVTTLATKYGFGTAQKIALLLIGLLAIASGTINFPGHYALFASAICLGIVIFFLRKDTAYWWYFVLLDGNLVLHALFLLIFR